MKFNELDLSPEILKGIQEAGFEEATPIQSETIPLVIEGSDVIGQAQTGTGKTAAFGLPTLDRADTTSNKIQTLIISPTRELAIQTQEELYKLGKAKRVKVQAVYGGADIRRQINNLKNHPQILVGTPGRLLDHINRKTVRLENVNTIVLDEADEMLDMGFIEDIQSILETVPNKHQTLLFSATMPKPILNITKRFMTDPKLVQVKSKELTAKNIKQYYVKAKDFEKFDIMTRIFDVQAPELSLVFGRTKRRVDELTRGLQARGYRAEGLHGDLTQQKRMAVLRQFKEGKLEFLIATDVAARGLDISGVTHVYNYDIPQDPDSYVHRIGRTGRAGKSGVAVTFITPNEMDYLKTIEQLTKVRMDPLNPPTDEEALVGQFKVAREDIAETIKNGDLDKYADFANELLEQYTPQQLVEAYIKAISKDSSNIPVKITPERPLPSRKRSSNRRGGGHSGGYKGNRRNSSGRGNGNGRGGYSRDRRNKDSKSSGRSNDSNRRSNGGNSNKRNDSKKNGRNFTIRTNNK
ncbi:DEAD-box ATP-dependent RNA helicase CshA [Companilactobacillus sp. RD055328]|uniref:DEAD/DEAH box helicase n=1 Tax=Companilactobacillus sp. RD055328 TaxID=2916634 RepID=UPI001FC82958|nr:DEAD/DEAH box helicase [Companilactobacillus sp. RD055328]GKQ42298.1 DEAD-box ATP-dependent RNA helicase CshA [Companilactobacillus sp. RD055328]